ncbi:hypothetical protein Tco_0820693 [Tanacetum coccineum]|uniref:Uncharacterized protein n=1 Tax=Tanacetum coccineum TaxID=301880 RepID=A0ABQ5ABU0_9ASTR
MHPPTTPSTKDTSYLQLTTYPDPPTASTSLSQWYLNPPTSHLQVSSPPPTQENASMDITLTLSPIPHLMANLILHHLHHLSLSILFLRIYLKHMFERDLWSLASGECCCWYRMVEMRRSCDGSIGVIGLGMVVGGGGVVVVWRRWRWRVKGTMEWIRLIIFFVVFGCDSLFE